MSKIKIKETIISRDKKITENIYGSLESGIISYRDTNNSYIYLDINRNEFLRENAEISLKYLFELNEKTIGKVFVKELDKELELYIITKELEKDFNRYYVSYQIEDDIISFELLYEEVEV